MAPDAADRAAKDDPRFPPIAAEELEFLNMEVWVLWGKEEVSARGEDRVKEVVIGKGVSPGELVVTEGQLKLLPGTPVEILDEKAAPR